MSNCTNAGATCGVTMCHTATLDSGPAWCERFRRLISRATEEKGSFDETEKRGHMGMDIVQLETGNKEKNKNSDGDIGCEFDRKTKRTVMAEVMVLNPPTSAAENETIIVRHDKLWMSIFWIECSFPVVTENQSDTYQSKE